MLNTETHAASPFLLLETRRPLWLRDIGRLGIIPTDAAPPTLSGALAVDDAIDRLIAAGLACAQARGPRLHLLGGTNIVADREIRGYENAFAILAEPDGRFLVLTSGPSGYDEESTAGTLAEAVDAVISIYRSRGALGPAGRGR